MERYLCDTCLYANNCQFIAKHREGAIGCSAYINTFGVSIDRLREICEAERDGRLVLMPCKVGDMVYTIKENYFDCENCPHGDEAEYDPELHQISCSQNRRCPLTIEEHIVEGFNISKSGLSDPGEWGYEGIEIFRGVDGEWHLTRAEAEAAIAKEGR
jgi:hypothetical protein